MMLKIVLIGLAAAYGVPTGEDSRSRALAAEKQPASDASASSAVTKQGVAVIIPVVASYAASICRMLGLWYGSSEYSTQDEDIITAATKSSLEGAGLPVPSGKAEVGGSKDGKSYNGLPILGTKGWGGYGVMIQGSTEQKQELRYYMDFTNGYYLIRGCVECDEDADMANFCNDNIKFFQGGEYPYLKAFTYHLPASALNAYNMLSEGLMHNAYQGAERTNWAQEVADYLQSLLFDTQDNGYARA